MWNGKCASVVNQISSSAQDDDRHQDIQDIQYNSPTNTTKDKNNKFEDKIEGFM